MPDLWSFRGHFDYKSTNHNEQVWKFLLGVYDIDSTAVDRVERMRTLREQYRNIRWQWQAITDDQAAHWAKWRERRNQARFWSQSNYNLHFQTHLFATSSIGIHSSHSRVGLGPVILNNVV